MLEELKTKIIFNMDIVAYVQSYTVPVNINFTVYASIFLSKPSTIESV